MRIEAAVTTISWIPSEAVTGPLNKPIFDSGVTHYDIPPPDDIGALPPLGTWMGEDRFRFANRLAAAIDVVDGEIRTAEYTGGLFLNATRLRLGRKEIVFQPYALPTLQAEPEIDDCDGIIDNGCVCIAGDECNQAGNPACPPPAGSTTRRSSSSRARWCGPPCSSPSTPTGPASTT